MSDIQSAGNSPLIKCPAVWKIIVLCFASAFGNLLLSYLVSDIFKIPLYLDTVFTIAVCFAAGLVPGILTGVLISPFLSPLAHLLLLNHPLETFWAGRIFTICVLVEIILVCFYMKKNRSREAAFLDKPSLSSFISLAPFLLTLAAIACIAVSITGGLIDFVLTQISMPRPYSPEDSFKLGLFRNQIPVLTAAILSRIPINIVDRLIVVFGAYGISLLYRKWLGTGTTNY